MLESENSFTRSIGDLALNAVRAIEAEERTKEKLENKQKERLVNIVYFIP